MQVLELLERPIVSYIIMGIFSIVAAVICFQIGGSFAKVSGQQGTPLGVGFEAGGALDGFLTIFLLSQRVIGKPQERKESKERCNRAPSERR